MAKSALQWLWLLKGGLGWLSPLELASSVFHMAIISSRWAPSHWYASNALTRHAAYASPVVFVGDVETGCTASTGNWWHSTITISLVLHGLPFMILVHNKAVGQTDRCWTRECLNKSSRWASLLWASLVSHLFIAPLSLISSHCLLYWHKALCPVRPRWCLIQLPRRLLCRLRTRVVPEQNTCPPLALCAEMSFETPKIYGRCSNIRRQMCSRNSSSHDTSSAPE